MNKWGYIVVLIIAVVVVVFTFEGFKIFFTPQASPSQTTTPVITYTGGNQSNTTTVTPTQTGTAPTGDTLTIKSTYGANITVKDFKNDPAVVKDPINPGYYYFGYHINEGVPDATATDTPPYIIQYIDRTQYFNISIFQTPIDAVRSEMEQYLMDHLGISKEQLCLLKYDVSIDSAIAPSGIPASVGFSFCPGATQFAN